VIQKQLLATWTR